MRLQNTSHLFKQLFCPQAGWERGHRRTNNTQGCEANVEIFFTPSPLTLSAFMNEPS
jgi:hypothetical protein